MSGSLIEKEDGTTVYREIVERDGAYHAIEIPFRELDLPGTQWETWATDLSWVDLLAWGVMLALVLVIGLGAGGALGAVLLMCRPRPIMPQVEEIQVRAHPDGSMNVICDGENHRFENILALLYFLHLRAIGKAWEAAQVEIESVP